jgi:beta-carotene hydroxylase
MYHPLLRDPAVRAVAWRDLRRLTPVQTIRGLLLLLPWLLLSLALAEGGWLLPACAASAVMFMAGLRQAHDSFHLTLPLPRWATEWFLFGLSVVMVVPLHAVKFNHLRHHARPLEPDDIEGACARMPGWLAVLAGPLFTARMLCDAMRRADNGLRTWVGLELTAVAAVLTAGLWIDWLWLRYHLLAMLLGNCLTGFFAVWLVHHDCAPAGLFARTQRGWLVNALTFNLFYHLEHHLFPAVPACRLPELAERIDAVLPGAREQPVLGAAPTPSVPV